MWIPRKQLKIANGLSQHFIKVTGDDSTCIMSFYGWQSIDRAKSLLYPRYQSIAAIIQKLDAASATGNLEEIIQELWLAYKPTAIYDEMQVHN